MARRMLASVVLLARRNSPFAGLNLNPCITHQIYTAFEDFSSRELVMLFSIFRKHLTISVQHGGLVFKQKTYLVPFWLSTKSYLSNWPYCVVLNGKLWTVQAYPTALLSRTKTLPRGGGGVMTLHDYGYLPPEFLKSYPVSE